MEDLQVYLNLIHLFHPFVIRIKKPSKKVRLFLITIFCFSLLLFLFLTFIHYECPYHKYLHLWCPGCGATRMVKALLHFDFYQAFRYNPLLFILLVLGGIYFIFLCFYYTKKKELIVPGWKAWILFAIIVVLYMILRNLEPFVYLIPTEV